MINLAILLLKGGQVHKDRDQVLAVFQEIFLIFLMSFSVMLWVEEDLKESKIEGLI